MRIRRRPPQIPAPASADPAAVGGSSGGEATGASVVGAVVGMGEIIMGTGGLHPTIEATGKGWRSWGEDSVSWRLGQQGGGARGGGWAGGGSGSSFHGEVQPLQEQQMRHKGKVAEEEDAFRGSEEGESEGKDQKPGAAAQPAVGAHKTGGDCASAAANGVGSDAFESATGATTRSPIEHASASRKRKNFAWSSGSSRSARSPSSSSSSVKTEISSGGGITSYMHAGDHQPVKDVEEKNGEEKLPLPVNGRKDNTGNNNIGGKRRRSPAVLMEGSRCSRVNGRGWRCCQQTLVGYSLCEHHLGKGRLRSVSSVRCKKAGGIDNGKQFPSQQVSAVVQQLNDKQRPSLAAEAIDEEEDEDEEETNPAVGARRGKRIGVVKARSISSLLGQTCSDVLDHSGAIQEAVGPEMALSATSAGLPAAAVRSPIAGSTPITAAAVPNTGSLPPPTAAHPEGITAVM